MGEVLKYAPSIPIVGDTYRMQSAGVLRMVEVTETRWDDTNQELQLICKPIIGKTPYDIPEDGDEV